MFAEDHPVEVVLRLMLSYAALGLWRHKKRGSCYRVLGGAIAAVSTEIKDGDTVVVYVDEHDGSLFVRKHSEFHDGRFERI